MACNLARVHITADTIVLEPLSQAGGVKGALPAIQFQRKGGPQVHSSVVPAPVTDIAKNARAETVCAVFGVYSILSGPVLVCAKTSERVANIAGHDVFRARDFLLLPFVESSATLTAEQRADDAEYFSLLEEALKVESFYFSYEYDLTQRVESHRFAPFQAIGSCNAMFMWNHRGAVEIESTGVSGIAVPFIIGFVGQANLELNGQQAKLSLVSRRSRFRPGTRFIVRGTDPDGNVANHVETEQILEIANDVYTYTQVRGSIPVFWSQRANVSYKPKPRVVRDKTRTDAAERSAVAKHVKDLAQAYRGQQLFINLVNQKGSEKTMSDALTKAVDAHANEVDLVTFDFHRECSKMRWHRLSLLMDRICGIIDQHGYTTVSADRTLTSTQKGVARTNCMDCLDRTNVVQSMIGRHVLEKQCGHGFTLENAPSALRAFKCLWADHGDAISRQYAGTNALKGDFTRTGKRDLRGLFNDGWHSIHRYVLQNFYDGRKQDGLELIAGRAEVVRGLSSPFANRQRRNMSLTLFGSLVAIALCVMAVRSREILSTDMQAFGLYTVLTTGLFFGILRNGSDFVVRPCLRDDH